MAKSISAVKTFDDLESYKKQSKKTKKYATPSHLKDQIEWSKTPEGQAYYRRKLSR